MSQERFAEELGTSRRNVMRWEGDYHRPSHVYLCRIATLTRVSISWLVEGDGVAA